MCHSLSKKEDRASTHLEWSPVPFVRQIFLFLRRDASKAPQLFQLLSIVRGHGSGDGVLQIENHRPSFLGDSLFADVMMQSLLICCAVVEKHFHGWDVESTRAIFLKELLNEVRW